MVCQTVYFTGMVVFTLTSQIMRCTIEYQYSCQYSYKYMSTCPRVRVQVRVLLLWNSPVRVQHEYQKFSTQVLWVRVPSTSTPALTLRNQYTPPPPHQQLRCARGIIMWMPTSGHSSNHKGYNNSYRYNRQDCKRTPQHPVYWPEGRKRQFHRNPRIWRLQFLRSAWDCQHHADQPETFTPPHMERNEVRGSHRTHRKLPLIENTSLNQDQIKTNCVEEFPYSCDALNAIGDAPTILMGKTLIQAPASRNVPKRLCL